MCIKHDIKVPVLSTSHTKCSSASYKLGVIKSIKKQNCSAVVAGLHCGWRVEPRDGMVTGGSGLGAALFTAVPAGQWDRALVIRGTQSFLLL